MNLSVVIPTYNRGDILLKTISRLTEQTELADEILIVDQTRDHPSAIHSELKSLQQSGLIRWVHRDQASIAGAMNQGLALSYSPIVLFLDDDVDPRQELLQAHLLNYSDPDIWAVAGQVLQPGESVELSDCYDPGQGIYRDLSFRFNGSKRRMVMNAMAGNLSVRRDKAISAGGFDENFEGVAYRFETEFCRRLIRGGGKLVFDPEASVRHLQAPRGGAAALRGIHLRSASSVHSVGDYYFGFRESSGFECFRYSLTRLIRAVRTRFHFMHPWWIPVKLLGEIRGLLRGYRLSKQSPKLLNTAAIRGIEIEA